MALNWNPAQQKVLDASGNLLVVGAAGTGKTELLIAKAARLIESGIPAAEIDMTSFAYRSTEYLRSVATERLPQQAPHITFGTLAEMAFDRLKAAGQQLNFASNNRVRQILRGVVAEQAFPGSLAEAEHIIRSYKSRAKKVPDNDKYYLLFDAYKRHMDKLHLVDRHDVIRAHILAMRNQTALPIQAKVLMVDNVQDATELQLIWLKEHLQAGLTLVMAGNDDLTAFALDGAQGKAALEAMEGWPNTTKLALSGSYRTPASLAPVLGKVPRLLRSRAEKPDEQPNNRTTAQLTIRGFASAGEETGYLLSTASELIKRTDGKGKPFTVGIITRDDFGAHIIAHRLKQQGLNPASFARPLWEDPIPQTVLGLLYLLLNKATDTHLRMVLLGFGLPPTTVVEMAADADFTSTDWLPRGCPFPPVTDASPTTITTMAKLRRTLGGAWQLMQDRKVSPRDVFKAMLADMLPTLPEADQPAALLTAEMLLSLTGKLTEVLPRVVAETLPDMSSPITVAPVREVRNRQFHTVILPRCQVGVWPPLPGKVLPTLENLNLADHERRLFYLALTRSSGNILITHHAPLSPMAQDLQTTLKQLAKQSQ